MKKYLALILAVLMLATVFAGCASTTEKTDTPAASTETTEPAKTEDSKPEATKTEEPAEEPTAEEGKVFNIYAWNEEFKGFFEKYYTVPEGVTVNWIITPSADGAYQDKLDEALLNQENASADEKVDLFLAEADYIQKYTESPVTQDVAALGVTTSPTPMNIPFRQRPTLPAWSRVSPSSAARQLSFIAAPSPRTFWAPTIPPRSRSC